MRGKTRLGEEREKPPYLQSPVGANIGQVSHPLHAIEHHLVRPVYGQHHQPAFRMGAAFLPPRHGDAHVRQGAASIERSEGDSLEEKRLGAWLVKGESHNVRRTIPGADHSWLVNAPLWSILLSVLVVLIKLIIDCVIAYNI